MIKKTKQYETFLEGEGIMKRRSCAILMALSLGICGLTGCGGSQNEGKQEKIRLMVWSPSEDQSKESG